MTLARTLCAGLALSFAVAAVGAPRSAFAQAASRRALASSVKELTVDGISLSKTMDYLRDCSSANIVVNWKVLEAAGVSKDTPITLSVKELPLRKMMQLVLDQASPNTQLVYTVEDNVIEITSQEDADKHMITKVYLVDDLIMQPSNKQAPSLNLGSSTTGGNGNNGGGYGNGNNNGGGFGGNNNNNNGNNNGGGGLFNNNSNNNNNGYNNNNNNNNGGGGGGAGGAGGSQQSPAQLKQQAGDDLVSLIESVIRPSIWTLNGGPASIKFTLGKLIVTAPISVQEAIGGPVNTGIRYGN